jgi:histone H3/H4
MDSDNDSGNSNDGPIHRRRTQGTRPPPPSSHPNNSMHRMSASNPNVDRTYHPTKEDAPYSDDDDLDEEEEEDDDDEHQRRHHQQSTYRGRGRPSQQQHLMDSSYDDNEHHDLPRYTGPLREQDRFLPIANVAKIMKKGVPEKGKIAKDAKETIQECVSEFISFITSEASDRCLQEKRKTINGEDIILAMLTLGFDAYVEPLRTFLAKVRDASKYDRTMTMGGELTDDLRLQVAQAQVNQTSGPMVQAQVATTVQVQPQTTGVSTSLSGQTIAAKPAGTAANPNGLEPYGHSVRLFIFSFISNILSFLGSCRDLYSK